MKTKIFNAIFNVSLIFGYMFAIKMFFILFLK